MNPRFLCCYVGVIYIEVTVFYCIMLGLEIVFVKERFTRCVYLAVKVMRGS
jgi:hypothetical protein